jgi:hypothetical protein
VHDPVSFQLAQVLREHFLGDPWHLAAQLRESVGALVQPPKDPMTSMAASTGQL